MLFLHTGFQVLLAAMFVMTAVFVIPSSELTPALFVGAGIPLGLALAAIFDRSR